VAARKSFLLRISPELWEELSRWASDELRSVNGHIEFLLREAVRARRRSREAPGAPASDERPGAKSG
jgi:hypothetical protein